jgi:DNA-binding MarR family transcriptional regulator
MASSETLEEPSRPSVATRCVMTLLRTGNLLIGELTRRFRGYGLSHAGFNVLMILQLAGRPLSQREIGERWLVTRGAVTGLVDSLEAGGLVRRQSHPDDRRVSLVELTDKGVSVLDTLMPDHLRGEEELLSTLTEQEQQTLLELLEKIQARLGGMPF